MSSTIFKPTDPPTLVTKSLSVQRKIILQTIEEVFEGDFEQARRTMDAWEAIGWDPGAAVANALSDGHGYEIKEIVFAERFSERIRNILRETGFAQDVLLSYHVQNEPDAKLIGSSESSGMEIILPSKELVLKEKQDLKTIKITAIVKGKLRQISSSTLWLT